MAFAVASGNFSSASIWDTGVVPTGSEDAYANSFTVSISDTQSVGRVRNDANPYYLANTATPSMTGPTNPLGSAIASATVSGNEPWRAFDRSSTSGWTVGSGLSGWIGFQFTTGKVIKQYSFRAFPNATRPFATFTFEGSMNGSVWFNLDSPIAQAIAQGAFYTSNLLTNTVAYTYYRITGNGTVGSSSTLGVAEVEMTESTSLVVGQLVGGTFNLLNSGSLTCTATQGVVIGSTTQPVQFSGVSGSEATLTANLPAGTVTPNISNYYTILHNGTGTLNINGDIVFSGANNGIVNRGQINSTSTGILRINGAISSTTSAGESTNQCIRMTGGRLYVNGTVSGGSTGATGQIIVGGTSIIEITGNVNTTGLTNITGGSNITVIGDITNTGTGLAINAPGAPITVTGALTVNSSGGGTSSTTGNTSIGGSITCAGAGSGITTTTGVISVSGSVTIGGLGIGVTSTTGVVTIGGNITASTSNVAVQSSTLVKCSGLLFNNSNIQAVYAPRITIEPTTTSITFQKIGGGNQIMYIGSSTAYNLPATNNVRSGSVYGQSNEYTGTMIVQTPENVLLGTLVDNTVGTLIMTPANLITELNTSGTPVAVRLRNCATVSTTGDQMASYSI